MRHTVHLNACEKRSSSSLQYLPLAVCGCWAQDRRGDRREQRDRAGGVPAAGRQRRRRRVDSQGRDERRSCRREAQRPGALQCHLPPAGHHRRSEHRSAGRFLQDPFREAGHPGK